MKPRPPVLFVGHEATRTGAPAMLLHLLRWLRANTSLDFRLVLLKGGPVTDEFRAVADTEVLDVYNTIFSYTFAQKVLVKTGLERVAQGLMGRRSRRKMRQVVRGAALVYANSGEAARLAMMGAPDGSMVLHLHEMEYGLRRSMRTDADDILAAATVVIAASQKVADDLATWHPGVASHVEVIHECIDVGATQARDRVMVAELRSRLGIPDEALVVAACGTIEWRKAPELFLAVAARVARLYGDRVYFLWVGGDPTPAEALQLRLDTTRAGLEGRAIFVPTVANALDHLTLADVFVLTSREDPFPLVCIEAAALGTPVVCFDSTGTVELVDGDAGVVVPHLDVTAMADSVVELLRDTDRRRSLGAAAVERARRCDVALVAPRVAAVIDEVLACS